MGGGNIIDRFVAVIVEPAILLIFSLGFLLFVWGLVVFIMNLENDTKRKEGQQHMLWGIVGMFIMVAVGGIVAILNDTFELGLRAGGSSSLDRGQERTVNFPTFGE